MRSKNGESVITAARFKELKEGAEVKDAEEGEEYRELLLWEKRCASAKKANATKRARYSVWPSRGIEYAKIRGPFKR